MEVHHHPTAIGSHTTQRKWTHYFWEFFMLFLAVTLGFFVENQREHYVEHKREKQYMIAMVKDLQTDLKNIQLSTAQKERTVNFGDSLIWLYTSGIYKTRTPYFYYYARNFSTYQNLFFMTDGTLTQLKNSGGLRLIREIQIVDSLQAYDNVYQEFRLSQERESYFLADYRNVMTNVFDVKVFDPMVKSYSEIIIPAGNPSLFDEDRQLMNALMMKVHIAKRNKLGSIRYLLMLEQKAKNLIISIDQKYHLK